LQGSGLHIFSISEKGKKSIYEYKFSGPKALIMGSEEDGISKNLLQLSNQVFKVPMKGTIDSLNVSVATAIALYEMGRTIN
ncbi:MAG: TrmH family RNA methyltransferase, partial [Bacteroidota bacterium]|nr:TrmH family RNA methyltransferase [Bacteroidota bacterium]